MTHLRIEDYALIGDLQTAALVGTEGSVDWLCLPRFDSGACFASLLGDKEHGRWRVSPVHGGTCDRRRYRGDSLILESEWDTDTGSVRVTDFMPPRDDVPNLVRVIEGLSGSVTMRSTMRLRFDYGHVVPWVRHRNGTVSAVAGPDAVWVHGDVPHHGREFASRADFTINKGERASFVLSWRPSHLGEPQLVDTAAALQDTEEFWAEWVAKCTYTGAYRDSVVRSLITLKALTYAPTGGIVAAPTTSLPEDLGGVRNWDYRYCWLRDATLTLQAMLRSGYTEEASQWRHWLLRAIAGSPQDIQIMYGVAGERRIAEFSLDWLPGYRGSAPVRVGNSAAEQLQLDVYGEVINALSLARRAGVAADDDAWRLELKLLDWLVTGWQQPDEGLWEVRGPRRHFTHSKVLAWAAFDRAILAVETYALAGPVDTWRKVREEIHAQVLERAWDDERKTFTQSYGSQALDAATLLMGPMGFLPHDDPRMLATVEAVRSELLDDAGFLRRYGGDAQGDVDGLPGAEGSFLACSFWLVDALAASGSVGEATELFERLVALQNDVGLLAEEYDARYGMQVGNFPQAFTHLGLVNSAFKLADAAQRDGLS